MPILLADILGYYQANPPSSYSLGIAKAIKDLRGSLELDGYELEGGRLVPSEADVVDTKEESGTVRLLYEKNGLADATTTFHHLELSEEHYLAEKWDDSISNSRKFLESVLAQIVAKHAAIVARNVGDEVLSRPVRVRDYLEGEGLLEAKEKQAVAAVYGLLSETGGHPYVAQKEQARLMRHLALTFAQFTMLRLRGFVPAS